MRMLLPEPRGDADPAGLYAADERPAPAGRPWVLVNMISSLDGAAVVAGTSGALGGPADKVVFRAVRAVADAIVVGAGTVRAERYGPPRLDEALRAGRRARGQDDLPRLVVVSRSLDLDPDLPLFAEPGPRPLVLCPPDAAGGGAWRALGEVDDVVPCGDRPGEVDLAGALGLLGDRGCRCVLAEGGPSLNGDLLALGLVDELCLTLAPLVVGGDAPRIARAGGPGLAPPEGFALERVLEGDGMLFVRAVRTVRAGPVSSAGSG
jgi:riboflavin biosynthesis pyrimidine reductase